MVLLAAQEAMSRDSAAADALASSRLPQPFHGDPADRIIVATARTMGARLVTRDSKIREYARKRHLSIL